MSENTTEANSPYPPSLFRRNSYGLLDNVKYEFNPDGSINWRALIPKEFLVPNKEKTQETDVTKLEDKDLIILLGGLKYLAKLRGYTEVRQTLVKADPEHQYVAVNTKICWVGNYETDNQPVCFEELADAHPNNTTGFGKQYLTSIAANRGFVRAVRNFLGINIVGDAELKGANMTSDPGDMGAVKPQDTLEEFFQKNKCKFENVKNLLIKNGMEEATDWNSSKDIPTAKVFEVQALVKKAIEEKVAKKSAEKGQATQS
jgi:hypothetical protein